MTTNNTPKPNGSVRTQFKPGQSGNPKGRPKGSKNLCTLVKDELDKDPNAEEAGSRRLTKRAVIARTIVNGAMTGNPKHVASLLKITGEGGPHADQTIQSGVLVVPIKSTSVEEWERDHGAAAKGKPPPPGFGPVRKEDDEPTPQPIVRVL
jgi:hypothetical protein